MSMTRKDYSLIAKVIEEHLTAHKELKVTWTPAETFAMLASDLAEELKTTNPAFDRKRFLTACGFPDTL